MIRLLTTLSISLTLCGCLPMPRGGLAVRDYTPLHRAACSNDTASVKKLLSENYSANARFWYYEKFDGGNPLTSYFECWTHPANKGPFNRELVDALINAGADVNTIDSQGTGRAPLNSVATASWKPERILVVDFLASRKASVERIAREQSPLANAAMNLDVLMVEKLISLGAKVVSHHLNRVIISEYTPLKSCHDPSETSEDPERKKRLSEQNEKREKSIQILDILFRNGFLIDAERLRRFTNDCGTGIKNSVAEYIQATYPNQLGAFRFLGGPED